MGLCFSRIFLSIALIATSALAQVNINTASTKELMSLGLNKTQALNIIKYRKAHKFKSVDEIVKVRGISFAQAQNLESKIRVSNPTTKKKNSTKNNKKTRQKGK